ncbi:porin [Salmonella enterica]|nr:porin [Salmonella enterica]EDQ6556879.1 porin [Salmonella enterica subsp. enterica]EAY8676500.1 porin [Salmonella enterica]EBB7876944.1 porin [Salmonella enterica]ECE3294489.1 porin [Salmonella enterica]
MIILFRSILYGIKNNWWIIMRYCTFSSLIVLVFLYYSTADAAIIYQSNTTDLALLGRLKAKHYFSDTSYFNGDQTQILIGFRGDTKINDDLTSFAYWQYNVRGNQSEGSRKSNSTRMAYAGLTYKKYHQFDYGRNYGIMNDVGYWSASIIPEFGGWAYSGVDNFMTYRTSGVATYRNKNGFGFDENLKFALQFQGKNDGWNNSDAKTDPRSANPRSVAHQNGNGIGASLTYDLTNSFSFGASFASSERTEEQQEDGKGSRANGWNGGFRYDDGKYYFAAVYAEVNNLTWVGTSEGFAKKNRAIELTAQYQFDNGFRPLIAYQRGYGSGLTTEGNQKNDLINYLDVTLLYAFNKNISVLAEYKINLLRENEFTKKNKMSTDDILNTSLIYSF